VTAGSHGRYARGEGHRALGAVQSSQDLFERMAGRVISSRIDELAWLVEPGPHVADRRIDGRHERAGRIQVRVDRPRLEGILARKLAHAGYGTAVVGLQLACD